MRISNVSLAVRSTDADPKDSETSLYLGRFFEMCVQRLSQSIVHGDVVAKTSRDYELRWSVELAQALRGGVEESVLLGIEVPKMCVVSG